MRRDRRSRARCPVDSAALQALAISCKVAAWATLLVFGPACLLGWTLARRRFPGRSLLDTLVSLPLVLPPTAVGYVLLRLFALDGLLGPRPFGIDLDLLFTWRGATMASAVMSLPLVAQTARVAFREVDPRLEGLARTLGMSPLRAFASVTLPLAGRGLCAAAVLGFGRALGEFGATVIVAGNIPGRTQTLALAIYSDIQSGRDAEATHLLLVTVALAFAVIYGAEILLLRRGGRT